MGDALPAVDLGAGLSAASFALSTIVGCAVLPDGAAKCWGFNFNGAGALGLGDTQNRGDMPGEMGDALPRIKLFSEAW